MNPININESGLCFGPFDPDNCFPIESSKTYAAIKNDGVKMAEFLWIKSEGPKRRVLVVEAKSSSPQKAADPQRFAEFIGELRDKLRNGLSLGIAAILGRHPASESELPPCFRNLELQNAEFRLVVVINGHEDAWLDDPSNALRLALHATIKTWGLGANAVAVLNERMAKAHGLIAAG